MKTYMKFFATKDAALEVMRRKNKTTMDAHEIFCVVDGPEDNYAVVDIETAIDLDIGYEWSVK